MKIERVSWRPGYPSRGLDATQAREALEAIAAAEGGQLTADSVVAAAKKKRHYFHNHFEWNDATCGQHWRLQQARQLIGSIMVVYEEMPTREVRSYEIATRSARAKPEEASVYAPSDEAMSDPDVHARLVSEARRALQRWQERYSALAEFSFVNQAIERALQRMSA